MKIGINCRRSNAGLSIFLTIAIILLLISNTVTCRPQAESAIQAKPKIKRQDYEAIDVRVRPCDNNDDLNELCQRCAKVTKHNDVFPMCCSNEDNVTKWCADYVYYGVIY